MRIEPAAKRIGIEPKTHYNWLEKPDYKQGYEFVKKMFADYLEADMMDECITGQEKPVIYQGAITGYYREKNTREREIILKGLKPEYRDSFSPAGAAAPITLSIISPIAQPAEIDVTPPKKDE